MKRAYLATVLDLSLPVDDDPRAVAGLARGVAAAMRILEAMPLQRVEVAIAGAVTSSLLRYGQEQAVQMLAERAGAGQVSFLATAAYGAFLPLVPEREAARQLALNDSINREAFGHWVYRATGLFPPQLGYTRALAELALRRGLPRMLVDDLAYRGGYRPVPRDRHFTLADRHNFRIVVVDRLLSQAIGDGLVADAAALHERIGSGSSYAVVRIPARLLAEGAPALRLLATLDGHEPVLPASLDEIEALFPEFEVIDPLACALGTEPAEMAAGVQFAKWSAPSNELHALLWRLVQLASDEAERVGGDQPSTRPGQLRNLLDESLDCAAWRFASGRPERDPRRVAEGGARLLAALRAGGDAVRPHVRAEAEQLFARLQQRCAELGRQHPTGPELRAEARPS